MFLPIVLRHSSIRLALICCESQTALAATPPEKEGGVEPRLSRDSSGPAENESTSEGKKVATNKSLAGVPLKEPSSAADCSYSWMVAGPSSGAVLPKRVINMAR